MQFKIDMLRCFATVAASGNLTDAADKLGRTPSAVSMMLKQFENQLGGQLFETDRKSKLTALGSFVLQESQRELEHFERTIRAIESFARSEAGFVRVAAVPSVAVAILPRVVDNFLKDSPGVSIDIRDMDSNSVLRELRRERVDLGIATDLGSGPEIESDELFSDVFGLVCRADHPLASVDRPLTWDAISAHTFIGNGLCEHIAHPEFQQILNDAKLMVHNTTSLLAMVRVGVGVTVLPRLVIHRSERELNFLPLADKSARRRIEILRRANNSLSPATQKFEKAIGRVARKLSKSL
ncbi:MAG: LysR family transcriptional regulator [Hyphomicrobiaceae bacterium]